MQNSALQALDSPDLTMVAILRGLDTQRAQAIGERLYEIGFRALEVPLNRPQARECIEILCKTMPADMLVGAGTVTSLAQVQMVQQMGGRLVVSPHCDVVLIEQSLSLGLLCIPGVFTASEAFLAWRAGARALKLFPADVLGLEGFKSLASILPPELALLPVGGVGPHNLQAWRQAGATGFGIGGYLFKPSDTLEQVSKQAQSCIRAWHQT
jgi:2-dehydro-3-deoxyphosphogalactonate aldolase